MGNRFGFLSYNADRTANGVDHFLLTMDSVNGNVGIGTFGPEEKLHVNGNVRANAYFYNSDKRYKTDIQPLESALAKITSIGGYKYFNTLTKKNDIGLIAQDIEHTFPELVATDAQGYKTVAYANLVAPLVEAIKELNTTVQQLFDQYLSQQAQIDELRNELQLLKHQINS